MNLKPILLALNQQSPIQLSNGNVMAREFEGLSLRYPDFQNSFSLFEGEWAYDIPIAGTKTGPAKTFYELHHAVFIAKEAFGSLDEMTCLELGPNEGEVSFHLHHAGCRVKAVEARVRTYLKCLIVKNNLQLDRVQFFLGDFIRYLELTDEHFDLCVAAGMLYHMEDPIRILELLAKRADRIVIATHYFNENMRSYSASADKTGLPSAVWDFEPNAGVPHTHGGIAANYYKYIYAYDPESNATYGHGGVKPFANMMKNDDILRVLKHFGMTIVGHVHDDPAGMRGAHMSFVAQRA